MKEKYLFGIIGLIIIVAAATAIDFWTNQDHLNNSNIKLGTGKKVMLGEQVPNFEADTTSGVHFELKSGTKIKIVNFWASWCNPCMEEMPSLANFALRHKDDIELIAVSGDDSLKDIEVALNAFSQFRKAESKIVFDQEKKIIKLYGVTGFPETYVVSKTGALKRKVTGSIDWNSPEVEQFFNSLKAE